MENVNIEGIKSNIIKCCKNKGINLPHNVIFSMHSNRISCIDSKGQQLRVYFDELDVMDVYRGGDYMMSYRIEG